jgi:hypothetical protein
MQQLSGVQRSDDEICGPTPCRIFTLVGYPIGKDQPRVALLHDIHSVPWRTCNGGQMTASEAGQA